MNITNDVILSCLRRNGSLSAFTNSLGLILSRGKADSDVTSAGGTCTVKLAVEPGNRINVTFLFDSCDSGEVVFLEGNITRQCSRCAVPCRYGYTSAGNRLTLKMGQFTGRDATCLLEAVPDKLEVVYLSNVHGYVQTPGHDKGKFYYPMDTWTTLHPPWRHVFLSIQKVVLVIYDMAEVYTGGRAEANRLWKLDVNSEYVAQPVETGEIHVHFKSINEWKELGFQMMFSYHPRRPYRTGSGLWNCSVSEWPDLHRHFLCDVIVECEGREDEGQCSYTGRCGQDHLTIQNRCYAYIFSNGTEWSWLEADLHCRERGGNLASLNTPGEVKAVQAVLRMRRKKFSVYIGLRRTPTVLPFMYKFTLMWEDTTIAYYLRIRTVSRSDSQCVAHSSPTWRTTKMLIEFPACSARYPKMDILCELGSLSTDDNRNAGDSPGLVRFPALRMPAALKNGTVPVPSVKCPAGHVTLVFLACDEETRCWWSHRDERGAPGDFPSRSSCPAPVTPVPAMFTCSSGAQHVPYTMVCDNRRQCVDASDESFCDFPPCSGSTPLQCASSHQCLAISDFCNGLADCPQAIDEEQCGTTMAFNRQHLPPPAVVTFTPLTSGFYGFQTSYVTTPLEKRPAGDASVCPETHFQCLDDGYCLPVFIRCNSVNDCPGREDEAGCDRTSCPGFYRCRSSAVCLHPSHVCDGVYQCPQHDDELFCRLVCPSGCTCHGLSLTCRQSFRADLSSEIRYMDASGSGVSPQRLGANTNLIHLSVSRCGLETLGNLTFPNLHSLDLSSNELSEIGPDSLGGLPNLRYLSLAKTPLKSLFSPRANRLSLPALRILDISGVKMRTLNTRSFVHFAGLHTLNVSQCGIERVVGSFDVTSRLQVLDTVGCPMTHVPRDLLTGLDYLHTVEADNFKLCCPLALPAGFYLPYCRAPFDEVSSCSSLLRSDVYVAFLSLFCSLALVGNLCCFLQRSLSPKRNASGFSVFVANLSISDFLMGVYLAVIGLADRLYKGVYLWEDISWRYSVACRVSGLLSLLSNEVSAFIICLITLDRFLVLRFPFSSLRFSARSARITCTVVWVLVTVMAAAPLTPLTSHWSFYSQTGICIPLPITRGDFAGRHYAFGILIVFNFILFLCIAFGQVAIFLSVQANRISATDSTKKSSDLRVARRLISVAVTDFLCWFPIGLLGLLASRGVPISGEINVGIAILVLPLNSALNPFLYTINVILERRRRLQDEQFLKQFMAEGIEK